MHLILDGYCTNTELLRDEEGLKKWLVETVKVGGMHQFGEPQVKDFPFPGQEGTALSAVVFLGESSIVIHTYPEHSYVFLDVFHCWEFDLAKIKDWVVESLGISDPVVILLDRGLDREGKPIRAKVLGRGVN